LLDNGDFKGGRDELQLSQTKSEYDLKFKIQMFILQTYVADHCFLFVIFLLPIVLSVLLRFTASDYPFWYIQLFLQQVLMSNSVNK
jgi:hypothetical protein